MRKSTICDSDSWMIRGWSLEWRRDGATDGKNGDNKNNEERQIEKYQQINGYDYRV